MAGWSHSRTIDVNPPLDYLASIPHSYGMKTYTVTNDSGSYLVWFDRSIRLWTAFRVEAGTENQIAPAGYGITRAAALDDARFQQDD